MRKISPTISPKSKYLKLKPKAPAKILVIEDDACLQTILSRLLKTIDPIAEIKWLPSADEALREINEQSTPNTLPFSLFITDITTPGISSGIDVWETCQIKYPHTPFLFTSGIPVDEFFKKFGNSTVCPPFLAKPFALDECKQIIRIMLETDNRT